MMRRRQSYDWYSKVSNQRNQEPARIRSTTAAAMAVGKNARDDARRDARDGGTAFDPLYFLDALKFDPPDFFAAAGSAAGAGAEAAAAA